MNEPTKRRYRSTLRDRHAAVTRGAVLDAAHRLFLAHGYAGTSIDAIAAAAGVSERTVYNTFGDKPTLLYEVGKRVVSGQGAAREARSRNLAAELRAEPDAGARVALVAGWSRTMWERGMLQFESMLLDAAATDPRAAEVAKMAWRQKYDANRALFLLVFPDYTRRAPAELDAALDVLFAIDSAAFVRILIEDRDWSYDRFEAWLDTALRRLFLEPSDTNEV